MRITKGQLKRIVAEEHAIVYGTKRPASKITRKLTASQRRIIEAKKQRAILTEAKLNYAMNGVIEEGLGSFLKKLGGMAMKGAQKVTQAVSDTKAAWDEVSKEVEIEEKAKADVEKAIKDEAGKLNKEVMEKIKNLAAVKQALEPIKDDKEKVQKVYAAAMALVKGMLALPEPEKAVDFWGGK
jgi:methionyl-tRNA synthetase